MIINIDDNKLKRLALAQQSKSVRATLAQNSKLNKSSENIDLLRTCENDWNNLSYLRRDRYRNLRYKNGDQWGDLVKDENGKLRRESEVLSMSGKVPLKHNFLQQFMRNIEGQKLTNQTDSIVHARSMDDNSLSDMLTNTLQKCHHLNRTKQLDISTLEDLLICGIGCTKIRYTLWGSKNRYDGRLDNVNINRLFFNTDLEDPRLFDIRRIGEIHDYTFDELIGLFAIGQSDVEVLRSEYSSLNKQSESLQGRDITEGLNIDSFNLPLDTSKCRVFEIWEKKGRWVTVAHDYADGTEQIVNYSLAQIDQINNNRVLQGLSLGLDESSVALIHAERKYEEYWQVKFLTPQATCIKEMETPYEHQDHPYALAVLPMVDGSIRGVMSDLIDIQRYINRLIVMIDFIMGSSAKGVLMIPEDCIPDNMSTDDFADEWVKANGVIVYKPNARNAMPSAISSNSTNIGAWEMLSLQMNNMQKIAGLSGAVQGQTARSNTPASLYAQEAQNSMINYVVVFDAMQNYQQERDEKLLKVLMQYYTDKRHVDISGKAYSDMAKYYDPEIVAKIQEFNIVVTQSVNTPVFKQATEAVLMDMLKSGLINLDMFLDNSSMPFADKLKNSISSYKNNMENNIDFPSMDQSEIQALQEQINSNASPQGQALLNQFIG